MIVEVVVVYDDGVVSLKVLPELSSLCMCVCLSLSLSMFLCILCVCEEAQQQHQTHHLSLIIVLLHAFIFLFWLFPVFRCDFRELNSFQIIFIPISSDIIPLTQDDKDTIIGKFKARIQDAKMSDAVKQVWIFAFLILK